MPYNRIGAVLMDRGKLDEALKSHQDSLAIRERLAASDRSNSEWQRDLWASYQRIGEVLMAQGKERLAACHRSNSDWQNALEYSTGRIGDLAVC